MCTDMPTIGLLRTNFGEIWRKNEHFIFCIQPCRLQNGGHFVQAASSTPTPEHGKTHYILFWLETVCQFATKQNHALFAEGVPNQVDTWRNNVVIIRSHVPAEKWYIFEKEQMKYIGHIEWYASCHYPMKKSFLEQLSCHWRS